ncbi:MAG: sialate O-acetylesterase [Bacteroidales bacterium]|nr:sialate O-acetylesterase [Bacteroidales bacterium]
MKKHVKFICLILCAISYVVQFASCSDDDGYDIYLLIGQSNCAGRGYFLPEDTVNILDGVWLLNADLVPEPAVAPLNRYSNIRKDMSWQLVGPGMGFGPAMHQLTGRKVLLVQNARGGSALESWQVGGDGEVSYLDSALVRTIPALQYGKLKGIVWHQGETDITNGTAGDIYVERFAAMIAELRKRVGVGEKVPVVVGEVGQWAWEDSTKIEAFNHGTLDRLTREVPNCRKVSSDGLGFRMPDNPGDPHFSRDAAIELGQRYAEAMFATNNK